MPDQTRKISAKSTYTTLIFDLFGTLVNVFSKTSHEAAVAMMAEILQLPAPDFIALWDDGTYPLRSNGTFATIEENLAYICRQLNTPIDTQRIEQAARVRYKFTQLALQPKHDAIETLSQLKQQGYKLGLISNCAPDVPFLWKTTPFAPLIDIPIFSCDVKLKKPDPCIYRLALASLHTSPEECLYIGDGSDRELTAAKEIGMHPILINTSLSDAYDSHRIDVHGWGGHDIHTLRDILTIK